MIKLQIAALVWFCIVLNSQMTLSVPVAPSPTSVALPAQIQAAIAAMQKNATTKPPELKKETNLPQPIKDLSVNLVKLRYNVHRPYNMNMSDLKDIEVNLVFDKTIIDAKPLSNITVKFQTATFSPQFQALFINRLGQTTTEVETSKKQLVQSNYTHTTKIRLYADYMGHSILQPIVVILKTTDSEKVERVNLSETHANNLHVIIVQYEGVWGTIFIVSVSLLIVISYVNLGAQLDIEHMKMLLKEPMTPVAGFLLTVIVMPVTSWFVGQLFLSDQLLYRIGSFIFACGPAASASTLWTVMLDSDKELSVGLQVGSTIGALVTMPLLLYFIDSALLLESTHYSIKVPYFKLLQTLTVLMLSLFVGWRYLGRNEDLRKVSVRIFKPLTFFVILFIIIFSSIIYWPIYRMFDWTITGHSLIVALITYLTTGSLGYLLNCNIDHAVAISIGSAYKNSGIAFAILLVAFGAPETYIAYVPCLTQVVITSIILYLVYCIHWIVNFFERRNQPAPIQADIHEEIAPTLKKNRSGSKSSSGSKKSDENDELIAMDVTDPVLATASTSLPKNSEPQDLIKEKDLEQRNLEEQMDSHEKELSKKSSSKESFHDEESSSSSDSNREVLNEKESVRRSSEDRRSESVEFDEKGSKPHLNHENSNNHTG